MALHNSSSFLVTTSSLGQLSVWDLRKNNNHTNEKKRYAISEDKNQELNCCLFRNDFKNIITGGGFKGLGVWNWDIFSEELWTLDCG
jgi:WD40 repeat protein